MDPHPDFAVAITRRLVLEAEGDDGETVTGHALALGWYVDPDAGASGEPPVGTLYLVVDARHPRPLWVKQSRLTAARVVD